MILNYRTHIRLVLLTVMVVFTVSFATDIKFSGYVDRTKLSMDDRLVLTLVAEGKDVRKDIAMPQVPQIDFMKLVDKSTSMSSSSSFRIIVNGKDMSRESSNKITWTYVFTPLKYGDFVLPSFVLNVKGEQYKTNPLSVSIKKEVAKNNKDIIFKCIPQKHSAYVGEQFNFVVRIAIRNGANVFNVQRPDVEKELRKKFWVENLFNGDIKGKVKSIDGIMYNVFDIPFALYPIQKGKQVIPAMTLQYEKRERVRRNTGSGRGVFDDPFFNNFFGNNVRSISKHKISKPVTIWVRNTPNSPPNFSGGVGEFSISASVDKKTLPVGDALTLKVVLKGNSSFKNVGDPILGDIHGFDAFDPEKSTSTKIKNNIIYGTRTYKYVLIPQSEGNYKIGHIKYVYFDVSTKKYKTLKTKVISLKVTKGNSNAISNSVVGQRGLMSRQEIKRLGNDIRYIKTESVIIKGAPKPLHRSFLFILLHVIPILGIGLSVLLQAKRERLSKDTGYARRIKSKKRVKKRLSEAKMFLENSNTTGFYSSLANGILGYIGDLMNVESSGMTIDAIKKLLYEHKQPQNFVDEIIKMIEKCDYGRFASSTIQIDEMKQDMANTERLLNNLKA